MIELRNVLLAVDFSDTCLQATEYAVALARRFGATLHLLHVIEDPIVYLPMFESYPLPSRQQFETYAQDRLENWITDPEVDGLKIELTFRHGAPHEPHERRAERAGQHDAAPAVETERRLGHEPPGEQRRNGRG